MKTPARIPSLASAVLLGGFLHAPSRAQVPPATGSIAALAALTVWVRRRNEAP